MEVAVSRKSSSTTIHFLSGFLNMTVGIKVEVK